jgi:hypothetical protein
MACGEKRYMKEILQARGYLERGRWRIHFANLAISAFAILLARDNFWKTMLTG